MFLQNFLDDLTSRKCKWWRALDSVCTTVEWGVGVGGQTERTDDSRGQDGLMADSRGLAGL